MAESDLYWLQRVSPILGRPLIEHDDRGYQIEVTHWKIRVVQNWTTRPVQDYDFEEEQQVRSFSENTEKPKGGNPKLDNQVRTKLLKDFSSFLSKSGE